MINQGSLVGVECPVYSSLFEEKTSTPNIRIDSGVFVGTIFTLSNMKFVEANDEAMLQFDYDLKTGMDERLQKEFEDVVCAIVNNLLMKSIEMLSS